MAGGVAGPSLYSGHISRSDMHASESRYGSRNHKRRRTTKSVAEKDLHGKKALKRKHSGDDVSEYDSSEKKVLLLSRDLNSAGGKAKKKNHFGEDVSRRHPTVKKVSPRFRTQNVALIDWAALLKTEKYQTTDTNLDIEVKIENEEVSVCHQKLDSNAEKKIQQVLGEHKKLTMLRLRNCELSNKFLNSLLAKNLKINIEALDLSTNKGLDMDIVKKLVDRFQTTKLNLSNINLTKAQILSLAHIKGITELKFTANKFKDDSIAKVIVALMKQGLEILILDDSDISTEALDAIAQKMPKVNFPGCSAKPEIKLRGLDLSHITLDEIGVTALSKITENAGGLEWLNLHNCGLDGKLLKRLSEGKKKNVKSLTLSGNPGMKESIEIVALVAEKLGCEEIDISTNSITGEDIVTLACAAAPTKVRAIRICENSINDIEAVAHLVKKWKVKDVDISECTLYLDDIEKLAASLKGYKLDRLNVRHRQRCDALQPEICTTLKNIAQQVIC